MTERDENVREALKLAYQAQADLREEHDLMVRKWERHPMLTAMNDGANALGVCIAILEARDG